MKVIRSVRNDPARLFYQFSVIFDYHAGNTLELVTSNRSYRCQWVTKPGLSRRQRSHLEHIEQILSGTGPKKNTEKLMEAIKVFFLSAYSIFYLLLQ